MSQEIVTELPLSTTSSATVIEASSNCNNDTNSSIFLHSPSQFILDAQLHLKQANGTTYQRRPPTSRHDGQLLIRLKNKRFIVLDYSFHSCTNEELEKAKATPYIVIPNGAGVTLCATKECDKIGVPVQLYDTNPEEPTSLYLRGGLCFTCQRNLNEKRRILSKRKADCSDSSAKKKIDGSADSTNIHMNKDSTTFRTSNGNFIDLDPNAIVINGPVLGTRLYGPDYQFRQIGMDILDIVSDLNQDIKALMAHYSSMDTNPPSSVSLSSLGKKRAKDTIDSVFDRTFLSLTRATFLASQWKASWDEATSTNKDTTTTSNSNVLEVQKVFSSCKDSEQEFNVINSHLAMDEVEAQEGHDDDGNDIVKGKAA